MKKTLSRDEHFRYYDYIKMTVTLPNSDQQANMRLWRQTTDAKGFTSPQLNNAVCAVYLMDLTKSEEDVVEKLVKHKRLLYDQSRPDIISILIGNKSDDGKRKLTKDRGRRLAKELQFMRYIEVSSVEGTNIGKVLETILSSVERNQMW